MPTYNYPMVFIGNLANLKASLLISYRISCRVYNIEGSITRKCRNGSFYNLVIKQDVVDGELKIDVAFTETADNGSPRFALSQGTFRNKVRGLYYDNQDLDNSWAIDKFEEEEIELLWGFTTTTQRAILKHFPVSIFDNLEFCELLILFNGGYAVIKEGRDAPDDASKKKIANLHDALTLLTGC